MTELCRHIGPNTDVPAGDIVVGPREVDYLFGQYKRLANRYEGAVTGKSLEFGGSRMRAAATGHGVVYMMLQALKEQEDDLESANVPTTAEAVELLKRSDKVIHIPSKAANAGGVAVSGLELSQNSQRLSWSGDEVDRRLQDTMQNIHSLCLEYGEKTDGGVDYVKGANIAAFTKVASAIMSQGVM